MKKNQKMILTAIVALLLSIFSSCKLMDSLAYNVKEVKPDELSSVSGDYVNSKDSVYKALMFSTTSLVEIGLDASTDMEGSSVNSLMQIISLATPALSSSVSTNSSRSISMDNNFSDGKFPFTIDLEILDESKTIGEGSVNLEEVVFNGSLESDVSTISETEMPTWLSAEFKGEASVSATNIQAGQLYDQSSSNYKNIILEKGILNLKAKGNGKITFNEELDPTYVEYYSAMDLSLGFALSCSGYSGKYIMSFKFVQSGDIDSFENPDDTMDGLDIVLTVDVYDNSNKLINSYEYDPDYVMQNMSSLY